MPENLTEKTTRATYPNPANKPFFCPTPGYITLAAVTPNKVIPDSEATSLNINEAVPSSSLCQELGLCGFNCIMIELPNISSKVSEQVKPINTAITNCKKYGLALFVRTGALFNGNVINAEFIKMFSTNNYFSGWWLPIPSYDDVVNPGNASSLPQSIWKGKKQLHGTMQKGSMPRL